MDEEIKRDNYFKWLMAVAFLGTIAMLVVYIAGLKTKLEVLERQMVEQQTIQQNEIDGLSLNIETVRNDMNAGFESQQKQIDEQAEKITSVKTIVHNTNVALSRANKQIEEKESEIQELREQIKK